MAHGANGAGSAARAFACVGNAVALVFGCFISVVAIVGLVATPVLTVRKEAALRRQLLNTEPTARPALNHGGGHVVLLVGRVDPLQPVPPGAPAFALFERESERSDFSWSWEVIHKPAFDLVLPEGSVRVVNGCRYEEKAGVGQLFEVGYNLGLRDHCYRLGGTLTVTYPDGGLRFRGVGPGDSVSVVGTMSDEEIVASSVFVGSPQEYAASLQNSHWIVVLSVALGLLLLGGVVRIGWTLLVGQPRQPPNQQYR